jgi:hypothetical protein
MGSVIMSTQTVVAYVKTGSEAEASPFKLSSSFHVSRLSGDGRANLGLGYKTDCSAFLLRGYAQQLVWRALAWCLCGFAFSRCIGLLLYTTTVRLGHWPGGRSGYDRLCGHGIVHQLAEQRTKPGEGVNPPGA